MAISNRRGQVSLEMIVGLIILLVIAGIVIMLVMNTMTAGNISKVSGTDAEKYKRDCQSYCERRDYQQYCTKTFADSMTLSGNVQKAKDWNGDNQNGRLVKDQNSVWDFCEDRVYCFIVTKCPEMDMEGCRVYMCQLYMEKYSNTDSASKKLKEIYKPTDSLVECYREEKKGGPKTYFRNLPSEDMWIESGFVRKKWCNDTGSGGSSESCGDGICDCMFESSQSCSSDCNQDDCGGGGEEVTLSNCVYNSADDAISCDTNCQGTVSGDATSLMVMDKDQNISMAMDGSMPVGTITISGGKVTATPADYSMVGSLKLSSLDQDTGQWMAVLTCRNPADNGQVVGVTKV